MKKISAFLLFFLTIGTTSLSISQTNAEVTNETATNSTEEEKGFLEDYYTGFNENTETTSTEESPAIAFIRIFLITGILAFLTWVILRFFFRKNALALSTNGNSIEILATVPAGLGSYFLIAKLSNLYYLCSLSTEGLRLLDKITDQEAIDFIELNKAQTLPQDIKFVDLLEQLPEGRPRKALEFLRDKINNLKKK